MQVLTKILRPSLLYTFSLQILFARAMHSVFVYGTLKRGEPNHHWLTKESNGKSVFVGEASTKAKYPLVIATRYNIPFLLHSPGNGHVVKGEIYEVDDMMLSKLDELEGHPEYYQRELDDFILEEDKSKTLKCWVYFLKNFRQELLSLPLLEEYSSTGSHGLPYQESNNESTVDDLNDVKKE